MTGQQRAVLWIGLLLVGLNLVSHWQEIRSVIFAGSGITGGIPVPGSSGGGSLLPSIPGLPSLPLTLLSTRKATPAPPKVQVM